MSGGPTALELADRLDEVNRTADLGDDCDEWLSEAAAELRRLADTVDRLSATRGHHGRPVDAGVRVVSDPYEPMLGDVVKSGGEPDMARTAIGRLDDLETTAEKLGRTPRAVRDLVKRGLPAYRVGRLLRFDPAEVGAWLEAQRVGGAK